MTTTYKIEATQTGGNMAEAYRVYDHTSCVGYIDREHGETEYTAYGHGTDHILFTDDLEAAAAFLVAKAGRRIVIIPAAK